MHRNLFWPALGLVAAINGADAQTAQPAVVERKGDFVTVLRSSANAGIMVSSSTSARDTLGILVTGVTGGSAAEKAGLEEGYRIASVNGVNLKVHPADAGQMDMQGIMARRFQREMQKLRPGDSVKLNIYADSRYRDVMVKTEAPVARTRSAFTTGPEASKASLGAYVSSTGSKRDTLGVLVVEVAENGPLAKNNIYEGSRIAAIGGVDLRVPAASAGDAKASQDKANLLLAELGKLTAGNRVELRVYEGGRFRNVTVETARRGDLQMGGLGVQSIIRRGANFMPEGELERLSLHLENLPTDLQTRLQGMDFHVIPSQDVNIQIRPEIERAMESMRQGLQRIQIGTPYIQVLN